MQLEFQGHLRQSGLTEVSAYKQKADLISQKLHGAHAWDRYFKEDISIKMLAVGALKGKLMQCSEKLSKTKQAEK